MTAQTTIRTLTLSLVLVSGIAQAGLFSKKAKAPPPPPPEPAPVVPPPPPPPPPAPTPLEFSGVQSASPIAALFNRVDSASSEVRAVREWVEASKDNAGLPFLVVDKVNAQVYAFTPYAQLKATAPILLGVGVGDKVLVSPDAPMSAIPPEKRITPAGRYLSTLVIDPHGKLILSIDALNLISLHIVAKGTPAQRRAERLASIKSDDNRVSFGCINVPPKFFTDIVSPDFHAKKGIVYILPEKVTAGQLFGFQPAAPAPNALQTALQTAAATPPAALAPLAASTAPTMTAAATTAPLAGASTSDLVLTLPGTQPVATPVATPVSGSAPLELAPAAPMANGGAAPATANGRD